MLFSATKDFKHRIKFTNMGGRGACTEKALISDTLDANISAFLDQVYVSVSIFFLSSSEYIKIGNLLDEK